MNKTALEDLHFDTVVTAEYKLKMSAAASGSERGDSPVIFAEGGFDDGAAVTSTATEESAVGLTPLDSGLSQAYDDSTARLTDSGKAAPEIPAKAAEALTPETA